MCINTFHDFYWFIFPCDLSTAITMSLVSAPQQWNDVIQIHVLPIQANAEAMCGSVKGIIAYCKEK